MLAGAEMVPVDPLNDENIPSTVVREEQREPMWVYNEMDLVGKNTGRMVMTH